LQSVDFVSVGPVICPSVCSPEFLPFHSYMWTWWFSACDYDHQLHAVNGFYLLFE